MWHWALTAAAAAVAVAMAMAMPLRCLCDGHCRALVHGGLWSMTGSGRWTTDGGPRTWDSGQPAAGDGAEPLNQLPTADFWHSLSDSDNYSERLLRQPPLRSGFWLLVCRGAGQVWNGMEWSWMACRERCWCWCSGMNFLSVCHAAF